MDAESLTRRILERVRQLIFLSDVTQREVEKRVGFSRGYLSQLLGGTVEIKYWQLLAILHAMELDPAEFFSELFGRRRHRALDVLDEVRRRGEREPLSLELARLYAFGIESIADFHLRLERCEDALEELGALGVLEPSELGLESGGLSGKREEKRV